MPRFTYQPAESKYDAPEGTYRVKFVGSRERRFGKPSKFGGDGPRLEWEFEVVVGPCRGKTLSKTTGTDPSSPKSGCFKMLKGLLGRAPEPAEDVDTDQFVGREYEIDWEKNPESPDGNMHIARLKPVGAAPASPPRPALPPVRVETPPGPPPRPAKVEKWYVDGCGEQLFDRDELQKWLDDNHRDPALVEVNRAGDLDWKFATNFGFTDETPF
jgi:hypothetical protein